MLAQTRMWFFIAVACVLADVSALLFAFAPSEWLWIALWPAAIGAAFLALGFREEPKVASLVGAIALGLGVWQLDFVPAFARAAPWVCAALALGFFHPKELPAAARIGLVLAGVGSAAFLLLLVVADVDGDLAMIPLWVAVAGFIVAWRVNHKHHPDNTDWFYLATVAAHTVQAFQLLVPETPVPGNVIAYTLVLYYTAVIFFVVVELWTQSRADPEELFVLN